MVVGAEASKLDLLGVFNLLGITVAPFHRYIGVCVSVHEDVECAVAVENGEEGDRGSDLAENRLDLFLDFLLGLLGGFGGCSFAVSVAFRPIELARHKSLHMDNEELIYPGAAFSFSPVLRELELLELLPKISTSNCQRSTCSPVSLSVITITSFEIFPPAIHLLSCDMIFLIYALTWSSADTIAQLDHKQKVCGVH